MNTKPFIDWYGIWPGHTGAWEDGLGWTQDPPAGDLRLEVQTPHKSEVFITKDRPWEKRLLMPFCVIREDEKLKLWYKTGGDDGNTYVAYAESTDGFTWERPELAWHPTAMGCRTCGVRPKVGSYPDREQCEAAPNTNR